MKDLLKDLFVSARLFIFMSLLLGVGYPLLMTAIAKATFPREAGGSLIIKEDKVIGSELLSQKFVGDKYFWARPSAGDFNPLPSGGSNLGPSSTDLLKLVADRRAQLQAANGESSGGEGGGSGGAKEIPQELLFASASGLDPHISPAAAAYQVRRVAKARGLNADQVSELVRAHTLGPQFGILGEARVNVLALNLALENAK